jgi:flagellar basal-body rod modification protein FlgD
METTSVASSDYSSTILSSLTSSSSSSSTTSDAEDIYSTWISILCTQLENQDPTDPVDSTEFTSQLASIASLEQQVLTNDTLSSLLTAIEDMGGDSLIDYVGSTVTAYGDTTSLSDGSATWEYDLGSEADSVTLSVLDEDGNVVYTAEGSTASGTHTFTWDGTTDDGETAADGAYQLVVEATDADGDAVDTTLYAVGKVTAVDMTDDTLLMGNVSVPTAYVVSASAA